ATAAKPVGPDVSAGASEAAQPVASAVCFSGPGHRCCWEQIDDWFTYRPLTRDCCGCLPKCAPCCPPPLYTFFLGNCCVGSPGAGCCARRDTGFGSGHRLAGLWQGVRGCCSWRGWDELLFYHPKSNTEVSGKEISPMEPR